MCSSDLLLSSGLWPLPERTPLNAVIGGRIEHEDYSVEKDGKKVTLKFVVSDEFSAIGKTDYTVDSNTKWLSAVPDDLVYDTTEEHFTIVIEDLGRGEHIITIKVADDISNTTYKTFEVNIGGES